MTNYKAGMYLLDEISSQGQAWSQTIPLVMEQRQAILEMFDGIGSVVFTGCGSALNASLTAAPLFQMLTGISAIAIPAAETYLFPDAHVPLDKRNLVVLLSRSGKTTEVLRSLDYFQRQNIPTLGVTCTSDSPLALTSDLGLALTPLSERAVATTRSLTGMILAVQMLSGIVAKNEPYLEQIQRLPDVFAVRKEEFQSLGKLIGESETLNRYAFVGNGPLFGCARECQLKVKEMTLLPADSYPMFDFRHGPKSNVNHQMLVTALLSDTARQEEASFVQDMRSLGGVTWAICEREDAEFMEYASYVLDLESNLDQLARLPLYLPAVQYMAYYRALSLDLNPDEPRNLSYWVEIS
jgi:glucosamine--fructose-6-phosphate aminotransferase (isomerizing)